MIDAAAPAREQRAACRRGSRLVVDARARVRPASGVAGGARPLARHDWPAARRRDERHLDAKTEPRPGSERSGDRVVEHARDALDDRQAEPEAARHLGALVEPLELPEDQPSA